MSYANLKTMSIVVTLMLILVGSISFITNSNDFNEYEEELYYDLEQEKSSINPTVNNNFNQENSGEVTMSPPSSRAEIPKGAVAEWQSDVLADSESNIDLISSIDYLESHSGLELAIVENNLTTNTAEFKLVYRTDSTSWTVEKVYETDSLIQDIASIPLADGSGLEGIVFISTSGNGGSSSSMISLIQPDLIGRYWVQHTNIAELQQVLKAVVIGDIMQGNPGVEIVCVDEDNKLHISHITSTMTWETSEIEQLDANVVDIKIADTDPREPGNQLLIIDDEGNLIQKSEIETSGNIIWTTNTIWQESSKNALTALTVGDADNDDDNEILVATSEGKLMILDKGADSSWSGKEIFTDTAPIRDIAVVDIDPFHYGYETVCSGDSMKLTALYHNVGAWTSRILHEDTHEILSLTAGLIDSTNYALNEVVTVNGEGGEVVLTEFSGFYSETLYTGDNKLSGVCIGDIDPDHAGNEAIVVGMNYLYQGTVTMAYRDNNDWATEQLFVGDGELLTPVIGDFDNLPGNELAIVGMLSGAEGSGMGQATLIKNAEGKWLSERLFINSKLLHGAAVGELVDSNEGDELVVVGFAYNVTILTNLTEGEGGGWNDTHVWQSVHNVRKAMFADVEPDHPGEELIVVDKSGNLTMIYQEGTGWHVETLWTDPGTPGLARLAIGDADNDGQLDIIAGGDSSNLGLVQRKPTGEWEGKVIWTDSNKIRGLAIGDFEPDHTGNEIAVYGYSMKVTMLTQDESTGDWKPRTIFSDVGRGHDLAVGEFDSLHDGDELLLSGYSKNLTMVAFYSEVTQPDFELTSADKTKKAYKEETVELNLTVVPTENFIEQVYLELDTLPAGIELVAFQSQSVTGYGAVQINLKISPTFTGNSANLKINAHGAGITKSISFDLTIKEKLEEFEIVTIQPKPGEHDISTHDLEIKIQFSKPVDFDTATSTNIIIRCEKDDVFTGKFVLSQDNKTLTISEIHKVDDVHGELPGDSVINITVTQSVKDTYGNNLNIDFNWEFTTAEEEDHEEEEPASMEGLAISLGIIVIIIILMVIVGIIYGRKKKDEDDK